jgi:hypothetical protein
MDVAVEIGGDRLLVLIDAEVAARTDGHLASTPAHRIVGNNNR